MRRHDGVVLVISFLDDSPSSLELSGGLFISSASSPPLSNSSTSPCILPSISAISLSLASSLSSLLLPSLVGGDSCAASSVTVTDVARCGVENAQSPSRRRRRGHLNMARVWATG